MSDVIVVLRELTEDKRFETVRYSNVETVMPFGSQGLAIKAVDGTLILPMGRIREVIIPVEPEGDNNNDEAPQIIT